MSFTDEDLKRLKEQCRDPLYQRSEHRQLLLSKFDSLIARLEAAEKFCEMTPECNCSQECDYHTDALRAWRKEAGK